MNKVLEETARQYLHDNLAKLPSGNQTVFKRMYAKEGNIEIPIDEVVNNIDPSKLDWAMTQVGNSLNKQIAAQ